MDRVQILTVEISRAYKLAHKDLPKLDEIRMEAGQISKDLQDVPDDSLAPCYNHARLNSRSNIPTSRDIARSWYDAIMPDIEAERKKTALQYKPSHECRYCPVVALRLGITTPDATEGEIRKSKEPIDSQEIQCVLATVGKDRQIFEYWNTNPKSPYKGML